MKTHRHLRRVGLFAAFSLLLSPFSHVARSASSSTPSPSAVSSLTVSGTNTFLSGSTVNFAAGSTVSVSGTFGGTPSGGTLDLSNLTLTLGTPTITGALALPTTTTLGVSGPLVSSSLNARAGAQGVTTVTGGEPITSPDKAALNVGLSDFSYFVPVRLADYTIRGGLGAKLSAFRGWGFNIMAGGYLRLFFGNGSDYTTYSYDASAPLALANGTTALIGFTATRGGNLIFYVNGVQLGAAVVISGSAAQSLDSLGSLLVGGGGYEAGVGILHAPSFFNRTLTQPEIVALCERGVDAADIPATPASNTTNLGNPTPASVIADAYRSSAVIPATPGIKFLFVPTWTGGGSAQLIIAYSGTNQPVDGGQKAYTSGAPVKLTLPVTGVATSFHVLNKSGSTLDAFAFDMFPLGALACYSDTQPGIGYQLHDLSGNKADLILPASGATFAKLAATGPAQVRATLTWAGSHEAKSLLGQVALPANAVVTSIITTASAADPGGGMTVGSVTTPNLFVNAVAYTTAKKVHTLAVQLPAGTATNDLNLVVDPGTSNYTGTIQIAVNYVLAQ